MITISQEEFKQRYGDSALNNFGTMPQTPTPEGTGIVPPKQDFLQKAGNVVNKIFPGEQAGKAIGTLGGYALSKNKSQYDLSAPTPLQVGGDVLKGAAFVAGAKLPVSPTILGKTAQFGGLSAAAGAGQAITEKKPVADVAKQAAISGAVGATVGAGVGVAEKGIKYLANLFGKAGDRIQTSVIKPAQVDIRDGFKVETLNKYNLGGSLKQTFEKTDARLDALSKELNKRLHASNATLDLNTLYEDTAKKILGNKFEAFGSNAQVEGALEKLRNEIVAVAGDRGLVRIPEAQMIKRAAGHFGAWTFGVPSPEITAQQKVYNTFYSNIKNAIEKASPAGVREINKQMSELIPVMNALIRRIPVAERNSAISLTDIISLSASALEPRALSLALVNFLSKQGKVGALLSKSPQVGQAVSKGLEKTEPAIRTTISQVAK